jgi:hypothetical protein
MYMISESYRQIQIIVHYIVTEPFGKRIASVLACVFAVVFVSKIVVETDECGQAILLDCPHSIIHRAADYKVFIGTVEKFYIFRKTDVV